MATSTVAPAAPTPAPTATAPSSSPGATTTPASPQPAAPAQPSSPAQPEVPAQPAAAPEGQPATPAQPSAPAEGAEPQQADFPGDVVGFLEAHNAWERKRDGLDQPAADQASQAQPAEGEQPKPEDQQPKIPEPEQSLTPESLNALAEKSPELKAALEASPEVKNALFAMARKNAQLAPIGELFPNLEAAKFAAETSNTMVNLRTQFMEAIDSPESFPAAFEQFADEFAIKDKDGKPVLDAAGNPTYGEDFQMLNDFIVDTYHGIEIADLEAAQQAGKFAAGDGSADDMALQALKYLKDWKAGNAEGQKLDLTGLPQDQMAILEARKRAVKEREEALEGKGKQQNAEQRKQERANYELSVQKKVGGSVGSRLKAMIDEHEKAAVFIPSYVLDAKDPETGISVFAKTLLDTFEEKTYGRVDRKTGKVIGGVAYIRDQAKMLARRPPSPEAEQARVDFANRLIDEHLPAIFDAQLREIQKKDIADRSKRQGSVQAREQMAEREPKAGGGAAAAKPTTPQEAMAEAYKWVDQNFPDLSPAERTEKAIIKKNELSGNRY